MTSDEMPVTLVVSHLQPLLGIERAALEWAAAMGEHRPVAVVAIGGQLPAANTLPDTIHFTSLGTPLRDAKRVLAVARLRRFARTVPPDQAIVAAGIWAAVPLLLAGRDLRRRTIVWEHSLDPGNVTNSPGLKVLVRLARMLYPHSRGVVAVSRTLARHVAHRTGVRPRQIPNLVERHARREPLATRRVLAVGSLTATKNYRVAIEALRHLPEDVTLDVYGDGPERARLLALAEQLGIAARVTLHGFVAREAIPWSEFAAFVHPSHGETFGYVLYEAADIGLPVVATNASVMAELIPDQIPGIATAPDAPSFAAALAAVLRDGLTADAYAQARALRDEQLDPQRIIRAWNALLGAA